jgi:CBS domain-containing protein
MHAVAARTHSSDARVREWMTADPITATADMSIEDAAKTMFDHGFRHLPIVDGERAVGIVSIRDVAEWGIARAVEDWQSRVQSRARVTAFARSRPKGGVHDRPIRVAGPPVRFARTLVGAPPQTFLRTGAARRRSLIPKGRSVEESSS